MEKWIDGAASACVEAAGPVDMPTTYALTGAFLAIIRRHHAACESEKKALREALEAIIKLVDDGVLVRDISRDSEPGFAIRCLPIVSAFVQARAALGGSRG